MDKHPDEIMMGLDCCPKRDVACDQCPYTGNRFPDCVADLLTDAAAYIRDLQKAVHEMEDISAKQDKQIEELQVHLAAITEPEEWDPYDMWDRR